MLPAVAAFEISKVFISVPPVNKLELNSVGETEITGGLSVVADGEFDISEGLPRLSTAFIAK